MDEKKPTAKLIATGSVNTLAAVVIYLANQIGLEMPLPVALALVVVAGWVAGYIQDDPRVKEALEIIRKAEAKAAE